MHYFKFSSYNYKEMQDNGIEIDKIILELTSLKNNDFGVAGIIVFLVFEIAIFVIEEIDFLAYAILFALIGKITSFVLKVPIRFKENYNISIHALTLATILQNIYISINFLTGFTIKYFYIMYMGITDIYIITAILMIKADMIKRKLEVDKIIQEQQNIKKEFDEWNENLKDEETQKNREIHKNENE